MEKRHVPPSRKRYEAKFPLITIRVPKNVKDRFQQLCSKSGISARRVFEELLNTYIDIKSQPERINQPAPSPGQTLYVITKEPFSLVSPEGWDGPSPEKGDITADRNKIKLLEKANYKFEEVKKTF